MLLKRNRFYNIKAIFPQSELYGSASQLVGSRCRLHNSGKQFNLPSLPGIHPTNLRHAEITVTLGPLFGIDLILTYFTATLVPHQGDETCYCPAYEFPHREGGGKCETSVYRAWCSSCGYPCTPKTIDQGIGYTEFWGKPSYHTDWQTLSDCCEEPVYGDSQLEFEYKPEEHEYA